MEFLVPFLGADFGPKNGTTKKGIKPSKIKNGVVPQNILDKIKEQGPEIRSLLSQGEA